MMGTSSAVVEAPARVVEFEMFAANLLAVETAVFEIPAIHLAAEVVGIAVLVVVLAAVGPNHLVVVVAAAVFVGPGNPAVVAVEVHAVLAKLASCNPDNCHSTIGYTALYI